ncbi:MULTISPECIES: helix-turn-helix transcriptional regulator [unclassified Sphingobium]|uniref:helix-turn-helix transcriptional regulator n=1 Tax=unclassified Sphingobium TaxID=2611147 RepID=UPI0022241000|nr:MULTISPECIES: AlpA family phage regulatory protein [unclassified Sphingobium]MCW2412042.1 prophage regulatory protein [Sphingobium sp. B8D3D]MCW2415661.1 prophage regulatory protein [Sphingobium sp. B8D3A]
MTTQSHSSEALWRLPRVSDVTGLSRATIYRRMDAGTFPQRRDLGGNRVAWRRSEVEAWIEARESKSNAAN